MSEIAAIGRRHFVGCFAAVGATTIPCETPDAFEEAVGQLLADEVPALLLVDQGLAPCEETIEAVRKRGAVVILMPAEPTEGHPALDSIRSLIEVAAGANILGEY
jgi:vacuolar-type H+-ATPase subunit F/Vma7